jgi:hypothetical protein
VRDEGGEAEPVVVASGDEGGEPACLLARVCPECGRLADEDPPAVCPGCGSEFG